MSLAVRLSGITKRFGAVTALDRVDLAVRTGTIHALVGENGAGKTTLMRVLYGATQPDEGSIEIDGTPHQFGNSRDAIEAGIGMVSQHYGIIPELSCLQNLILGAEGGRFLQSKKAEERAHQLAKRMNFQFDWRREASSLSPSGAQKLEILKLLWRDARVMILDEPTAMLSPADSDALFASLNQLVSDGATVILVTHRLPEVLQHCAYVTVLRGGKQVADKLVSETNAQELACLIVGAELATRSAPKAVARDTPLLSVSELVVLDELGHEALKQVSFSAFQGEVVGIAGVDGSGQRELFQAIAGLVRPRAGSIQIDGQNVTRTTAAERLTRGLRIIPEDRQQEALVEKWSLELNAALGLQRLEPFARGALIDLAGRKREAEAIAERFSTKHGGLDLPIDSLSGGNQQRFVAGRALELNPKLILAFQPARGLDINATAEVYEAIRKACAEGATAVVVSFDLDELLENCDRVVAMCGGRLIEAPKGKERDRESIGRLMVGAA